MVIKSPVLPPPAGTPAVPPCLACCCASLPPSAGTTVALSSSNANVAQLSSSTVITAGQTQKAFAIQTSAVTAPTQVTITATAPAAMLVPLALVRARRT